jgi:hypothetical protein
MAEKTNAELLDPETIDSGFTPVLRGDLASVELDGEIVLSVPLDAEERLDGERGFDTHLLDRTAAVMFECFDGRVTIDQLVVELGDVVEGEADVIRADLVELAKKFGRAGLLIGVARAERVQPELSTPTGVPLGSPVSFTRLTPFTGASIDLAATDKALVIFWSYGCSFCVQIADELAALQDALRSADTDLILVARVGTKEENDQLLEGAGLTGAAVFEGKFPIFDGQGTPSAYLVEGGKTSSEISVGGPWVVGLAKSAAGIVDGA